MEENEEKKFTKKDLKLRAQERKLEEKEKKAIEKAQIKEEKERIRNSFGRKVRNFFLTIILVIILLVVGFFFAKDFLSKKEVELLNKKMDQNYQTALEMIENGEYKNAIDLLKTITSNYDNFSEVTKKLKDVEELYLNQYLENADKYLKDKNYDKALDALKKVDEDLQEAESIVKKKIEIHNAKIEEKIQKFTEENTENYEILKYLVEYDYDGIDNLKEEIDDLISDYKNKLILEVRELVVKNYEEAKEMVEKLEKILPEDKEISDLVQEISKLEPVSLLSLDVGNKEGKLNISRNPKNDIKDIEGNSYTNYISVTSTGKDLNTVIYKLNGEYSKLTGKICIMDSSKDAAVSGEPRVNIYSDGNLLYASNILTNNTNNVDFSVDIDDVDDLKIELVGGTNLSYFIANPTLTRK